jgi:hypothetical protein
MPPVLFALVVFEIPSHFLPELAWIMILLFMLPKIAGIIGVLHYNQLFLLRCGLTDSLPGLI